MAKLQKGIQDYFRIPILLKPIGQTPQSSVLTLQKIFNQAPKYLPIDDRYEPSKSPYCKILQKRQKNAPQLLSFMLADFVNQWSQFEIIYRCRFCVGVFNCQDGNLGEEWMRELRVCRDENRKMVGLIILSINNCNVQGIKQPSIIIPEKLESSEYCDFLQPWFYAILSPMEDYLCSLIYQLQKEDNGFIVFNKIEQKPQPRTLKKKKKGRCLKICGDLCLALHLIKQAYAFYVEAEDILKKVDDYLWALGCNQGKLACFTTDVVIEGIEKESALELTRVQCLNLGKRVKIPQIQTQNYFKILKIYTKLTQNFDEMSRQFLIYTLTNYSSSQKFSILVQLAMLYKEAGMIRKHNYMLFLASRIAIDVRPNLVGILLREVLGSGHVKQWPLVNANVIKLLIDNSGDARDGRYHLELIQSCCSVLTQSDVSITLQAFQRRNFKQIVLPTCKILQITSISCLQSATKPKINNLSQQSPAKPSQTGFFINWRKKQTIYKYQQQEQIQFQVKIRNNMNFPLRCCLRLWFLGTMGKEMGTEVRAFYLEPKMNKVSVKMRFQEVCEMISLEKIQCRLYNFIFTKPAQLFPPIKLQIYEQYPKFSIQAPETFYNEESSLFSFPLRITRTKSYLQLAKLELTISVYYNVEVGYQETTFQITNFDQQKYVVVLSDYPYQTYPDQPQTQILRLHPLKSPKKNLKKLESKLQCLRSLTSKYQISAQSTTSCLFQRSIWCQLVSITSPMQINFHRTDLNIVEEEFVVRIAVRKKLDDLTPYRIVSGKGVFVLSQDTVVVVDRVIKKMDRKVVGDRPLQVVFQWCNSTREKQCGTISFEIEPHPIMYISQKHIQFQVAPWNKQPKQQLKSPAQLQISYKISSSTSNLSHSFIVQPQNLPSIKKYILLGKTKIKYQQRQQKQEEQKENEKEKEKEKEKESQDKMKNVVSNHVKLKFFYQYGEEYLVGLKFEDGEIYWFPCLFAVVQ